MEHLVGNGAHLYRRNGHLVRTPIYMRLLPTERAYYSIAGTYSSTLFPASGWLDSMTYNNVIAVGSQCIHASLNPTQNMYWRRVYNAHEPETVWYQGAYGTSASSIAVGTQSAEAYMQFSGYRFVLPPSVVDLDVLGIRVSFVNGGGIQCLGPAYSHNVKNTALKGFGDFTDWPLPFYVSEYQTDYAPILPPQYIINNRPYDEKIDILADGGGFQGDRDLWVLNDINRDGGIPTLTQTPTKSYEMGSTTLNFVKQHRDFWITPIITTGWNGSGAGQYWPYYVHPNGGWWGCVSVWGISIEVWMGGY